jgi:selenocysteine-specific elongation factor
LIVLENGETKPTSDTLIISLPYWNEIKKRIEDMLNAYHRQFPLRRGISREELKNKSKLSPRIFNAVLNKLMNDRTITDASHWVAKAGHEIRFNTTEQAKVTKLMRMFESNPYSTPSVKECQVEIGEDVFNALVELRELVTVSADVVFRKGDYDAMVEKIRAAIKQKGQLTLAEVRDLFGTTRKYAQALLEHLDSIGTTMRDGDFRKLKNQ